MSRIVHVVGREILDSRGNPTVEAPNQCGTDQNGIPLPERKGCKV